ncbi:MAG: CPBP family glutamic-type intramembrane protease [Antricoccus sp.]
MYSGDYAHVELTGSTSRRHCFCCWPAFWLPRRSRYSSDTAPTSSNFEEVSPSPLGCCRCGSRLLVQPSSKNSPGTGTDALLRRMSVFTASLVFTVFWALWHVPLGFIKGYYHNEVAESGWIHVLNFSLSMVAFVILMNWLYFSTGRIILIPIIFHISANLVNELFMTPQGTKIIQTIILLIVAAIVVASNPDLFFRSRLGSQNQETSNLTAQPTKTAGNE